MRPILTIGPTMMLSEDNEADSNGGADSENLAFAFPAPAMYTSHLVCNYARLVLVAVLSGLARPC